MHILIIDNDSLYSWIVKEFIKREDPKIQVTTCLNADRALRKIVEKEMTPDLIILDWDMPMMDGFTFAATYAQIQTDHIPIVVLTNSVYKRDYEMAKTISLIKGYFLKPVNGDMTKEILSYSLSENNK